MNASAAVPIVQARRVQLRKVELSDAPFFLRLLNEPSWISNIGDRGVRSAADAEAYIRDKIWAQYGAYGYGMYLVELTSTPAPIGICGLVRRAYLSAPDLGFALLPDYTGQGYATEAARSLISHVRGALGIGKLYAIAKRGNDRSTRVLDRLGFRHEGPCLTEQGVEVELYISI